MEELTLVGRQTPTEGGPLDLLGVDGGGKLVVFELKRGTLARDAVVQVIDYASYLENMDLGTLANYISERSGTHDIDKIEDFQDWYIEDKGFEDLESLKPLRMFLVGLGVDDRTERMVRFLASNSGMDISLLIFHGFDIDGMTILAKRVEVDGSEDADSQSRGGGSYRSRQERWNMLNDRVRRLDIRNLFDSVRDMFSENWSRSDESPGVGSIRISLPFQGSSSGRRAYARIDAVEGGKVLIVFYSLSVALCMDAFRQLIEEIPYETYPRDADALGGDNSEIHFLLTSDEWETHKAKLTGLIQSLYEAWQNEGSIQ